MLKLDQNAARAADNKSAYIEREGKYIGAFVRAEYMDKQSTGSKGIGLTFKSTDGAEAQFYINLSYQHGTKNEGGHSLASAIMACLRINGCADPSPITFERWDKDAGQRIKVTALGFPELMNSPIGILIQMEIEKNSEKGDPRPALYAPFEASTEKTASEVLDKERCREPAKLEKMMDSIIRKPIVDKRPKGAQSQQHDNNDYGPLPDDHSQDIPF
ncbi:hypothetical protein [Pseudomonas sp. CCC4.4]|uniref:hypothetical protein n=1 Tax=Pseudomonas sp. CCC4.4 TaxID=3048612 RepID=UPI002B22BDAE|nr:hypothetical protein [Pseudomonas sp. CCC4.4]MEB0170061.1 hypothetical protein [Pseudomonas sp. CCC4.4]